MPTVGLARLLGRGVARFRGSGEWMNSATTLPRYHEQSRHDGTEAEGAAAADRADTGAPVRGRDRGDGLLSLGAVGAGYQSSLFNDQGEIFVAFSGG